MSWLIPDDAIRAIGRTEHPGLPRWGLPLVTGWGPFRRRC